MFLSLRGKEEEILIGKDIKITAVRIMLGIVWLKIESSKEILVIRPDIVKAIAGLDKK